MGKITDALKKAAQERIGRLEKVSHIDEHKGKIIVRKIKDSKVDPRLVPYFDTKSLISEQYKILRTNIVALQKKNPMRTIVMTSSIHSEGKTITSLNLAITLAQATQKPKVLLVDADMRRGRIRKYLGADSHVGLSEILAGNGTLDDAIFQLDVDNLSFISSGQVPANPSELLDSEAMKNLLRDLKGKFDYVLIDTPPIIPVTDAGIVGSMVDGVLMIIEAGRTQRGVVHRAEELLHQSHCKVIGHVLTNIQYHLPQYIYRYL
ncbi:MAG: CpsD/CapB family tyrosine-protein kinase [Candidatus Omnitrophica bacterium]|nr:CpsD/CapB family tyrosine-protein kinase [Candidatus Omnitrophota bacterium]